MTGVVHDHVGIRVHLSRQPAAVIENTVYLGAGDFIVGAQGEPQGIIAGAEQR